LCPKYFVAQPQNLIVNMLSNKTTKQKALWALAWVCFFWGTTWLASKQAVNDGVTGIQVAGMRQIIAGLLYIAFFTAKKQAWPKGKQWATIVILSILNFMLANGLSYWGLQYISSGLASIIAAIFPLWIVVINLFNGEKISPKAIFGLLLGFGGVCIIFSDHLQDFLQQDFTLGIILSVTATIAWAFGSLYTKKKAVSFNPYFSIGFQMLISGIVLSTIVTNTNKYVPIAQVPSSTWWAIVYLIIIGSILTFIAYIYSLQHLPTSLASLYAYVNPVVAVLLGILFFKEEFNLYIGIGGAVTIVGVYLVNDAFKSVKQKN
jgi:drug/metabolite transporter (DMT)-like permease